MKRRTKTSHVTIGCYYWVLAPVVNEHYPLMIGCYTADRTWKIDGKTWPINGITPIRYITRPRPQELNKSSATRPQYRVGYSMVNV